MSGPSPTSLADKQHLQRAHCPASRPALIYLSKDGHASVFWLLDNVQNIWCRNQHTGTSPKLPAVPMHNPTLESGMEKIGKLTQTFDAIPCHYQSLPIGTNQPTNPFIPNRLVFFAQKRWWQYMAAESNCLSWYATWPSVMGHFSIW